jgi:intein/homing endonuclease
MSNMSWKKIKDIKLFDRVMNVNGDINTVGGIKITIVGDRKMVKFENYDFYATDDHLFLTNNGWKTWRPDRIIDNNRDNAVILESDKPIDSADKFTFIDTDNGKVISIDNDDLNIKMVDFDPEAVVYDLVLDGDHTYIVEGFVVHNCGGDTGGGDTGGGDGGGGGGDGGGG